MLKERLAGFDFDLTPARARPLVAVPYVAIHVNGLLLRKLMRGDGWKFSARTTSWQGAKGFGRSRAALISRGRWLGLRPSLFRSVFGLAIGAPFPRWPVLF